MPNVDERLMYTLQENYDGVIIPLLGRKNYLQPFSWKQYTYVYLRIFIFWCLKNRTVFDASQAMWLQEKKAQAQQTLWTLLDHDHYDYLEILCSRLWLPDFAGNRLDGVAGVAEELPDLLLSSLKSSLEELRESFSIFIVNKIVNISGFPRDSLESKRNIRYLPWKNGSI